MSDDKFRDQKRGELKWIEKFDNWFGVLFFCGVKSTFWCYVVVVDDVINKILMENNVIIMMIISIIHNFSSILSYNLTLETS